MTQSISTVVLGGSGYVAGELLRLIAQHPQLELAAAVSESQAGQSIRSVFPNLQGCFGDQAFVPRDQLNGHLTGQLAIFSAAPHGASAGLVADVLSIATGQGADVSVVDASADFRYGSVEAYQQVYDQPHGAPGLLDQFACALPEHLVETKTPHIGHPGCFATAMLLAIVPLLQLGIVEEDIYAVGITGSTGSGRTPTPATHHPLRHSNLFAYKALHHRHAPEVREICETLIGVTPNLNFVPHSGPFARGIHMTVQARMKSAVNENDLRGALRNFYQDREFVHVVDGAPKLKDVVGSNYGHIGLAVDGASVAVFVVIDNLVKGAAGGAMQWMNRKLGLDESAGLATPGPAWV